MLAQPLIERAGDAVMRVVYADSVPPPAVVSVTMRFCAADDMLADRRMDLFDLVGRPHLRCRLQGRRGLLESLTSEERTDGDARHLPQLFKPNHISIYHSRYPGSKVRLYSITITSKLRAVRSHVLITCITSVGRAPLLATTVEIV